MTDFWSGKDTRVVLMQDNDQVVLDIESWTVKRTGVKAADGICGDDRDRNQFITNGFDISLQCKQQKLDGLKALLKIDKNADAGATDYERGVYMKISPLDGTSESFQARIVTVDDWDFASPGRTERNKLTIPMRARYFEALPAMP